MKKYLPWILIAAALVIIYLFMVAAPVGQSANVTLSALNESGISGTATITETEGQLMVEISMQGEVEDRTMPAHIHVGECPGVGAIAYPLNSVVDGNSQTTIDELTIAELEAQLPLAINVHESPEALQNYVACGAIIL